jgi:pimeloyl-ACP methyl ester carboxylesterase
MPKARRPFAQFAAALSLVLAAPVPAQPPNSLALPAPTGRYGIGVHAETIVDTTRREVFTNDPGDYRRFPVRIYYPARKGACATRNYMPKELAAVYTKEFNYVAGFERSVRSYSCPDVPMAGGRTRFPLLMFSHGLGYTHFSYMSLIEDLASHGNIVVAVDHTYGQRATHFPDAPLVKEDNSRWGRGVDAGLYRQATEEYPRLWAEDMRRVLDRITGNGQLPMQHRIAARADFNRIAYLGHSFGGMAAIYGTQFDRRIKGAVNMDGFIRGRFITPVASDAPLLVLNAEAIDERKTYAPAVRVVPVKGTHHMTFSDVPLMVENFHSKGAGPPQGSFLSGVESINMTRQVIGLFLDCVFEQRCEPLDAKLAAIKAPPVPAIAPKSSPTSPPGA